MAAPKKKNTKKKAAPRGRPTDYKQIYCNQLVKHMAKGLSFESFAGLIGVSKQTIYDWAKAHPEFLDSKSIGTEKSRFYFEQQGLKGMNNKISFFNDRIWRLNMINRFREEWTDRVDTDVTSKGEKLQSMNLSGLSVEDLKQLESLLSKANEG